MAISAGPCRFRATSERRVASLAHSAIDERGGRSFRGQFCDSCRSRYARSCSRAGAVEWGPPWIAVDTSIWATASRFHLPRLTRWLNGAIVILILNPLSQAVWGMVGGVVIALIVTQRLRTEHALWVDVGLVVLFFVIVSALGAVLLRLFLRDEARILAGRPAFGDLGGQGRRVFDLILRLHPEQRIELTPEDDDAMRALSDIDRRAAEDTMRKKYEQLHAPEPVSDDEWADVWRDIEARTVGSTTYGETLGG